MTLPWDPPGTGKVEEPRRRRPKWYFADLPTFTQSEAANVAAMTALDSLRSAAVLMAVADGGRRYSDLLPTASHGLVDYYLKRLQAAGLVKHEGRLYVATHLGLFFTAVVRSGDHPGLLERLARDQAVVLAREALERALAALRQP